MTNTGDGAVEGGFGPSVLGAEEAIHDGEGSAIGTLLVWKICCLKSSLTGRCYCLLRRLGRRRSGQAINIAGTAEVGSRRNFLTRLNGSGTTADQLMVDG